jgi:hypothetical protein
MFFQRDKGQEPEEMTAAAEAARERMTARAERIDDTIPEASRQVNFEETPDVLALAAYVAHHCRCESCKRHNVPACGRELRLLAFFADEPELMAAMVALWTSGYAEAMVDLREERLIL